ncbi:MAG TPA: TIGR03118 family protein [Jatrophihabitantaceae bacterium]|nr:TIGR03118 family protein [Jatrophihabitantaceae bacterium]
MRRRLGWLGGLTVAALVVVVPLPAGGAAGGYTQTNLVSDQPGVAQTMDPNLVNPWGMSRSATSPIWVSDNGTDVATLYNGDVNGSPVGIQGLVVSIPGGAPTGQVFNDVSTTNPTAFNLPGTTTAARFMFIGEDGDLSAWAGGTAATLVHHTDDAIYKGLAIAHSPSGPMLLAANFHDNRIDVFDSTFAPVSAAGMFSDPGLPQGYAPFNVAEIGGQVYVSYAKQDADAEDDVAGPAHGFIDVFTDSGAFIERLVSHSVLNSPWGMTIAPANFGQFSGDLLVGNFGDGRIHAFDPNTGEVLGTLRGTSGKPLAIDGLWALIVGDPVIGGTDAVLFSAGPDDETHGLFGVLRAS